MYTVYVGLGSNLGDRLKYLAGAVHGLAAVGSIIAISSIYESEPVEMNSRHRFYNMAIAMTTDLAPPQLLKRSKEIEEVLGRKPGTHLKDREIDIDILLYEGMVYKDSTVSSPHPRMDQRRFVLEPLCEIAPHAIHPTSRKTIDVLLNELPRAQQIERTEFHIHQTS